MLRGVEDEVGLEYPPGVHAITEISKPPPYVF
jgi:hypothetical protein